MNPRAWTLATLALASLFVLLPFRNELVAGAMLGFGDANLPWSRSLLHAFLAGYTSAWFPSASGGTPGILQHESQAYALPFAALAPLVGLGRASVLIYPLALAILAWGAYALSRAFGRSHGAGIIAASILTCNPFVWDQMLAGHIGLVYAMALTPWCFVAFPSARARPIFAVASASLFCALTLFFDPRIMFFVDVGYLVVIIARGWRAVPMLGALAIAFAINGGWTLPFFFVGNANPVPAFFPPIEDLANYQSYGDIEHALVFSGYFIHWQWERAFAIAPGAWDAWYGAIIFLEVCAFGFAVWRTRAFAVAAGLFVTGFFASMGLNGVPHDALVWFYLHVPFATLLREPVKFAFVMLAGLTIALTLAWDRSLPGRMQQYVRGGIVTALALLAIVPLLGNLTTPAGYGFHAIPYHADFVAVATRIERDDPRHTGRLAVFPPWLAEQSQDRTGPTNATNPFVFQNEIPIIDAKVLSIANGTDRESWRAFTRIYTGIESDPAQTLARFGVRYVVVNPHAKLSDGGRLYTPFGTGTPSLARTFANDPNFTLLGTYGPFSVYRNRALRAPLTTTTGATVVGSLPGTLRAALPTGALGAPLRLAPGSVDFDVPHLAIGANADDRCAAGATHRQAVSAYPLVARSLDATRVWIAGDFRDRVSQTSDALRAQDFTSPYAYTESYAILGVPIVTKSVGTLYAQIGALGTTDIALTVDGHMQRVRPAIGRSAWMRLGDVAAGPHSIRVGGSRVGVALGEIAIVHDTCASTDAVALDDRRVIPKSHTYFVPPQTAAVTARIDSTTISLDAIASEGLRFHRNQRFPRTTRGEAMIVDDRPLPVDLPLALGIGRHTFAELRLAPFAYAGDWNPPPGHTTDFARNVTAHVRARTRFTMPAGIGVPYARFAVLRLRGSSDVADATVAVAIDGGQSTRYPLAWALRHDIVVGPLGGGNIAVEIDATGGETQGTIALSPLRAAQATIRRGSERNITIDGRAFDVVRTPTVRAMPTTIASFTAKDDGTLVPTNRRANPFPPFVSVDARRTYRLRLTGLRPDARGRIIVERYDASQDGVVSETIADVSGVSGELTLPLRLRPRSQAVAFSARIDGKPTVAARVHATLEALDPMEDGRFVRIPDSARNAEKAIPATLTSHAFASAIRSARIDTAITYDPRWQLDGRHWIVNDAASAWTNVRASQARYTVQDVYVACMIASGLALLAVFLTIAACVLRHHRT